jgi:uncharacterized membrane protein
MITQILTALIGNYMTTAFVIGVVVASVHVLAHRGHRTPGFASGTFLNSFVIWAIGVAETINFVMHSVFGDYAAKTIGWAQSPFQLELAMSSLGIGVMAFILGRRGAPLIGKVALVIAVSVFGFGAAGGHIYQMIANHDYAANNSGMLLVSDIAINAIGLIFVIWHAVARERAIDATDAEVVQRSAHAHA